MLTDKVQIMFLSPDPDHLQTCRQVDVLPKISNLILHAIVTDLIHNRVITSDKLECWVVFLAKCSVYAKVFIVVL